MSKTKTIMATLAGLAAMFKPAVSESSALRRIDAVIEADIKQAESAIAQAEQELAALNGKADAFRAQVTRLQHRMEALQAERETLAAQLKTMADSTAEAFARAVAAGDAKAEAEVMESGTDVERSTRDRAARLEAMIPALQREIHNAERDAVAADQATQDAHKRMAGARCLLAEIAWDVAVNDLALVAGRLFKANDEALRIVRDDVQLAAVPYFSTQRAMLAHLQGEVIPGGQPPVLSQAAARAAMRQLQAEGVTAS